MEVGSLDASANVEIISETEADADVADNLSRFVGNFDNLVYFNEDEICGEVLESFHIQVITYCRYPYLK